jgi:hypothetical protein
MPKMEFVFPESNNVLILLEDVAFVTYLLPIYQSAYLRAKVFDGDAGSGSSICLSKVSWSK